MPIHDDSAPDAQFALQRHFFQRAHIESGQLDRHAAVETRCGVCVEVKRKRGRKPALRVGERRKHASSYHHCEPQERTRTERHSAAQLAFDFVLQLHRLCRLDLQVGFHVRAGYAREIAINEGAVPNDAAVVGTEGCSALHILGSQTFKQSLE